MKKLLLIIALAPVLLFSQTRKQRKALAAQQKADQVIINNLKSHNQNLTTNNSTSADSVRVREYIINQFKTSGLQPKGTSGYLQPFKIDLGRQIKSGTFLKVNGTTLAVKKDYFPLACSAQKNVSGMPAMSLRERGVPWFEDVKDWLEDTLNATLDINKRVQKEAGRAASKGATALFLYNSGATSDNLRFDSKDKTTPVSLPVIYITREGYNKHFNDHSQILDIELNVAFEEVIKNAENIAGFIDNGAASNIVIAAPYTYFFREENESITKPKDSIDIIAGTSVLIEVAKMLAISKAKDNNYTFIAYNGENLMSQSGKWFNNPAVISSVNYVINLPGIRTYAQDKKLLIKGYGTAANWPEIIRQAANKNLEISFDTGRTYDKDTSQHQPAIPVLDFFTVDNNNSNKDFANSDKIPYEEQLQIARFIYRLIEATGTKGKPAFAEKQ